MTSSGKTRRNSATELDLLLRDLARTPAERLMTAPLILGGMARFRVLRRLGAGGFGVVYLVRDLAVETEVALKTLPSGRPELIYRLKHEFRTLADIRHENLVSFYELHADEERCFFTMEYVPGRTFLEYVRTGSVLDQARLQDVMVQLARGLIALHQAGKLHRDVKPSNVLVTDTGRVVLLDFGLSTDIDESEFVRSVITAGTPAYMCPEQGTGVPLTAASDWFSVGTMLYEALTGRLPFKRTGAERKAERLGEDPPTFAGLSPVAPPKLVELCRMLLRNDPEQRPGDREVAEVVGAGGAIVAVGSVAAAEPALVGREAEMDSLHAAMQARAGRCLTVLVEGNSGVGKTALVEEFLAKVEGEGALVLRGRCYERERVPYQGIDSLVDDVCRFLKRCDRAAADALMPRHFAALARLFPVLGRIPSVEAHAHSESESPDEQELRRRGFGALRELFARIGDRYSLVLHIDDLQWGDRDTAALLQDLLRPPDAPSLLLILSYRVEDRVRSPCVCALAESALGEVVRVELGPLASSAAQALARKHLGPRQSGMDPAQLVEEAGCNPFFILELARFASASDSRSTAGGEVDLQRFLRARIAQLPVPARELLEAVAVAGHPISESVARRAAGTVGPPWEAWSTLVAGLLVRFSGGPEDRQVEPLHDRIRAAVASSLTPERVIACHAGLAAALNEVGGGDPEVLARHHEAAGELDRAHDCAVLAATQAERALAFDRAARQFRWALSLKPAGPDRGRLLRSLADALAHAGRGLEAAEAYLEAGEVVELQARTTMRREAALQLLLSGRIDAGRALAVEVLREVGLAIPRTTRAALAALIAHRALIRLRGTRYREVQEKDVPEQRVERMEHLWALSRGFSMVDVVRGAEFGARHLLLALQSGVPRRVAQGLALSAAHLATTAPGSRRTSALIRRLDGLDRELGDPVVHAYLPLVQAIHAQSSGAWSATLEQADEAERRLTENCTGVVWETWTARLFGISSLFYLGRWRELDQRVTANLTEALDRGNVYALTALMAPYGVLAWLARGDRAGGQRHLQEAVASLSVQGFHLQHYWTLMAETFLDLHAGDGAPAWARLRGRWPDLKRSLLLRIPFVRTELSHARGACAVAAALASRNEGERQGLLEDALRSSLALERVGSRMARSLSRLVRAAVAAQGRRTEDAARELEVAAKELEEQEMAGYAAAARFQLSRLRGGGGSSLGGCEILGAGPGDSEGFARMLTPGFPEP